MNITIERLFEKIGRLQLSQELLIEENAVLIAVKVALKAEIEKIEKDGETIVSNALDRLKKLL